MNNNPILSFPPLANAVVPKKASVISFGGGDSRSPLGKGTHVPLPRGKPLWHGQVYCREMHQQSGVPTGGGRQNAKCCSSLCSCVTRSLPIISRAFHSSESKASEMQMALRLRRRHSRGAQAAETLSTPPPVRTPLHQIFRAGCHSKNHAPRSIGMFSFIVICMMNCALRIWVQIMQVKVWMGVTSNKVHIYICYHSVVVVLIRRCLKCELGPVKIRAAGIISLSRYRLLSSTPS